MERHLLVTITDLRNTGKALCMGLFLVLFTSGLFAQADIQVSAANLTLVKTKPVSPGLLKRHLAERLRLNSPITPFLNPNATANSAYSNTLNFTGGYINGASEIQGANTITTLVADDLTFIGTPPYSIIEFSFSVANFNATDVTARPRVRFYANNGGVPGNYITGYSFTPITFPTLEVGVYTATVAAFAVNTNKIWAGITFDDNNGATGASQTEIDNLGQGTYDPPEVGSSTDIFFQTDAAGPFLVNNPVGQLYNFSGSPVANFAWEFVNATPIPIIVEYMRGNRVGNNNNLTWKITTINTPTVTVALERSNDNKNFNSIYSVSADAPRCALPFNYADGHAASGINFYRLKITDADGKITYSNIIAILNKATGFEIVGLLPNPVINKDRAVLNLTSAQADKLQLVVYDMAGRIMLTHTEQISSGSNTVSFDITKLSKGTYQIKGTVSDGTSKTITLVKQ